jgi:hypothetical protein
MSVDNALALELYSYKLLMGPENTLASYECTQDRVCCQYVYRWKWEKFSYLVWEPIHHMMTGRRCTCIHVS